jgi:hypothetical protein
MARLNSGVPLKSQFMRAHPVILALGHKGAHHRDRPRSPCIAESYSKASRSQRIGQASALPLMGKEKFPTPAQA